MRRTRMSVAIAATVAVLAAGAAYACWLAVPLDEMVASRPVIVVGKIVRIDPAPPPREEIERQFDTAYIAVVRVLKNTLPNTRIEPRMELPLSMPSTIMISIDIRYDEGQDGVWLLEFRDGRYWAAQPGSFQPLDQEAAIRSLLEQR